MNTYFGNAYVYKIFFLGAKICHAIMSCKTYEMTLFFLLFMVCDFMSL